MEELRKEIIDKAMVISKKITAESTVGWDQSNAGSIKTLCEALQILENTSQKEEDK